MKRISIIVHGQVCTATAHVYGAYAAMGARASSLVSLARGWSVWRAGTELSVPNVYAEIVAGLDREVAIGVAMDMDKIGESAKLDDLRAVLRRYLGGFAV